jgi:tRNA pseudouridine55 synthase
MTAQTGRSVKSASEYNGIVVVDKPAGMTSHDVVDKIRRLFRTKRVGHTGTLDPDATGVLVLCLGQATRLAEYLSAAQKHYATEVTFGVETSTLDASGSVLKETGASHVTEAAVQALLPAFRGTILQTPPMVSARHHEGKRLYELAREGVVVEREAREVTIAQFELTGFQPGEHPTAALEVTCSTGTYIRVLADDLGRAAGVGAMMQSLRRTWVGSDATTAYTLQDAWTLEELQEKAVAGTLADAVLPTATALRAWTQFRLTPEGLQRLRQGQAVSMEAVAQSWLPASEPNAEMAAVLDDAGSVCAIVSLTEEQLRPLKVLTQT